MWKLQREGGIGLSLEKLSNVDLILSAAEVNKVLIVVLKSFSISYVAWTLNIKIQLPVQFVDMSGGGEYIILSGVSNVLASSFILNKIMSL